MSLKGKADPVQQGSTEIHLAPRVQQEIVASGEEFLEEPALVAPVRSIGSIWSAGVALGRKDKRRPRIEGQPSTEGSGGPRPDVPHPQAEGVQMANHLAG